MTDQALPDISVVECGHGLAEALCAKILADFGADVIKVEPPGGDPARRAGPFANDVPNSEGSGQFLYLNANKRSITLDLETARGRQIVKDLVQQKDVFVTGFSPRRLVELGLDYARLQRLNPRLIATCISPFGQTGPYRDYKGSDLIAWHMGGAGEGTPFQGVTEPAEQPPLRGGGYQADYLTGWTAASATMAALFYRHSYGVGQLVDISAMEAVANMLRPGFAMYSYDRDSLLGPRPKFSLPWIFSCKDGYITTAVFIDHWWEALKDLMGRPDWAENAAFDDVPGRRANADALEPLLTEWFMQHTREDLYEMLPARGVPCFPVNSMREVVNSSQYAARGFFVKQQHPVAGQVVQPGAPIRYSKTPWSLRRPAPLLGQHNREVLCDLQDNGRELLPRPTEVGDIRGRGSATDNQPLRSLRVLDFGWILSIPHCTAWLGTLGAEVIRVESRAHIDTIRLGLAGSAADGIAGINRSSNYNGLNFGKKGITLNVATQKGLALARELVKISDVVTENFATGVMERLGLSYEALRSVKPDIIMFTGSTLGTSGPEREATGWGPNVGSYAGLPSISGYSGGPPVDLGGTWPDYMIGTMMVFALLGALHHRRRTGQGQHVEVAMGEVVTTMIPEAVLDYTMNDRQRRPQGNRDYIMAPHDVYPCRGEDKWVAIAVGSDSEWTALCRAIGRPEMARNSRFVDATDRHRHHGELNEIIADWTRRHTPYDAMHVLQAAGIAAGPVMSIADLMADPHLQERGFVVEIDHPEVGPRTVAGLPVKFSAMPRLAYSPTPCVGEHNREVFQELLSLSQREFDQLMDEGVIF